MANREQTLKTFGAFLLSLRGKKSLKQVELTAVELGVQLPKSSLQGYEKGRVGGLNEDRLRAISTVYDIPYEKVLNEYIKDRFSSDLLNAVVTEELLYTEKEHAKLHAKLQLIIKEFPDRLGRISYTLDLCQLGLQKEETPS